MKILYVSPTPKGGMLHYSSQLLGCMPESIEKALIIGDSGENDKLFTGTTLCKISLKKRDVLKTTQAIIQFTKTFKPDIIHFTDFNYLLIPLIPFIRKYPIIVTAHDVSVHEGSDTLFNKIVLRLFLMMGKYHIVHGEGLKNQLAKKGFKEERISIIPHGDYSFFLKYKNEEVIESCDLLFFGRILKYKGLDYLLKAMKIVIDQNKGVRLVIAGSGDIDEYQPLIESIDITNLDIHNSFIPDHDVPKFFMAAKIVVLPYIEASQTGVVPIAYAFKKPVIATSVGAIPEMVEDGITGLIVPPKDENALAEAIIQLLNDDPGRKLMGEQAYVKMRQDLSWETVSEKTTELYTKVVSGVF